MNAPDNKEDGKAAARKKRGLGRGLDALFSDAEASVIYGAYTALVYITPVVGGYLADKYLGQRKAVLFGAVLLTLGHFFMAFEGDPAAGTEREVSYPQPNADARIGR